MPGGKKIPDTHQRRTQALYVNKTTNQGSRIHIRDQVGWLLHYFIREEWQDGEVVVFNEEGKPDFDAANVQRKLHAELLLRI